MDGAGDKAFDFAQEATKQLLALTTGVLALTVTFHKDVAATAPQEAVTLLQGAWLCYLVSAVCGVLALLSLAGNLERPGEGRNPSIYRGNIRIPAVLQALLFLVGLTLTIAFGARAV